MKKEPHLNKVMPLK